MTVRNEHEYDGLMPVQISRVPVPDPTVLTTAALRHEIAAIREMFESGMKAMDSLFVARLEKIEVQFHERDLRFDRVALEEKAAMSAALMAQKEAASKAELSFTKQIDQMHMLLNTITSANSDKIGDLKSRIDLGEGRGRGNSDMWGYVVGALGIIIAIATVAVLAGLHK